MRDLKNKVAVVTGAGSGIGTALALELAQKGAVLALVDINKEPLELLASQLTDGGSRVSVHVVDVSDRTAMEQLPEQVVAVHGHVDILINNAGVSVGAMFEDHSVDDAEWLLKINLFGVIYGCKFFLPLLKTRPEAHIVNLSSMFALFAMPGQAMYSASKSAVQALSEALWTELANSNVRVTTVHPGTIKSRLIETSRMSDRDAQQKASSMQEKYGMDTERAAQKIIRAIERNKYRVLIGVDAYLSDFIKRLFPVGFQRLITGIYRLGGSALGK